MLQNIKTEDSDLVITDINIKKLIPNVIDNFLIGIIDDHHTIILPMNVSGTQFKTWKKGRGGIFSKDVLNYTLKKPYGKYVLIKDKKEKIIARVISESEELQFKSLKLIDGQIKDKSYMILLKLKNGKKFLNTQRYINEKDIIHEEDVRIITSIKTSQDDDHDHYVRSISLFNE
jgi:hypothetical protein